MSSNRCETSCECGFWSWHDQRYVSPSAPGLMTNDQYMDDIGVKKDHPYRNNYGHGNGYGYREDWEGTLDTWWRSPDGTCSSSYPQPGYTPDHKEPRRPVAPQDQYRFMKLECAVCHRLYVGWYRQQPSRVAPVYELYDTSFYYAFNDEPSNLDLHLLVDWKPDEIAHVLACWLTIHAGPPSLGHLKKK